ncbi:MAG: hypothetical protein QOI11_1432, partial [Candidatus Eremiobacteraeota bacterium]|nr:hypothetical protein [Candidatus Eremiobacteraeota bacterium]
MSPFVPGEECREIDARILVLARLAASRLDDATLPVFRSAIERRMALYGDRPYFQEWLAVAARGPQAVRDLLLDLSEHGRYMRTVAPVRALVTR